MANKDFTSLKDLEKYLNSNKGQSQLLNQLNIKGALNSEMEKLHKYLLEEMDSHYSSFKPMYYERTGAWIESITISPVKQVGNTFSATITFDDNFAYHPSVTPKGEDGYVPWLMEVGWKDKSHRTPHFDGFSGTNYIKNAVDRWNKTNKFGFTISVYHGNERYI
jgi:hypothetical protein